MKLKKYLPIVVSVLLILSLFAGCGAASMDDMDAMDDYGYGEFSMATTSPAVSKPAEGDAMDSELSWSMEKNPSTVPSNQKLIRTIRMDAETENLDALLANVEARVNALGGYIESRDIYNYNQGSDRRVRDASLTIRIPAPQLDSFVDEVSAQSNITSINENTEDVTLTYVEVEARMTALETQQTRLLELLAQAETMEDLLLIEQQLTDVRTELEQVKSQLRVYDNLVDYGTVHLSLQEVKEYTEVVEDPTFWERISSGFMQSMENTGKLLVDGVVMLITVLPYFLPAIVVGGIVLLVLKLTIWRKKKEKKDNA